MKLIHVGLGLGLLLSTGCAMEAGAEGEAAPEIADAESIGESSQALVRGCASPAAPGSQCWNSTDSSGLFKVRIKQCPLNTGAGEVDCPQERDFVTVSSGALIGSNDPNGFITAASSGGLTAARGPGAFKWYSYSVGIQIGDVETARLTSLVRRSSKVAGPSRNPATIATLPTGFIMVGGGAAVATSNPNGNHMLVSSRPIAGSWFAESRDGGNFNEPGVVVAQIVGIPECIDGICFRRLSTFDTQNVSSGFMDASALTPAGYVLTAVGGYASTNGADRFLSVLMPVPEVAVARSRDYVDHASGSTTAANLAIQAYRP
jgi:hypothetical protein